MIDEGVIVIVSLPAYVHAENWLKLSRPASKLSKKLNFANSNFYDAGNIVRTATGDITLRIKEV